MGVVLFPLVWTSDPVGPGLVFTAFFLATGATALAALPGLVRGSATAWLIGTAWTAAYTYWSVYKVFALPEFESAGFLAAGAFAMGLLVAPSTPRHLHRHHSAGSPRS